MFSCIESLSVFAHFAVVSLRSSNDRARLSHVLFVSLDSFSLIRPAFPILCFLRTVHITSLVFRIIIVASCGSSRFSLCDYFVFFSFLTSAHTLYALPPNSGGSAPEPGFSTLCALKPRSVTSHALPHLRNGDENGCWWERLTEASFLPYLSRLVCQSRTEGLDCSSPGPFLRVVFVVGSLGEAGRISPWDCGGQPRRSRPYLPLGQRTGSSSAYCKGSGLPTAFSSFLTLRLSASVSVYLSSRCLSHETWGPEGTYSNVIMLLLLAAQ